MSLKSYAAIGDALVRLMHPLVEVVIHDLKANTICYKNGELSRRQIDDPSLLDADISDADVSDIVYPKLGIDGKLIRSISIVLEKKWLLCINCDVSIFNEMSKLSQHLIAFEERAQPHRLFVNDWQERLHKAIHDFVRAQRWRFAELSLRQKKELIKHLFEHGAFSEKNAADYVARSLGVGRATVFNYLREWRGR